MELTPKYDGELQMFVDSPRNLDANHLAFMRWLAEHDRLEDGTVFRSTGSLAEPVASSSASR